MALLADLQTAPHQQMQLGQVWRVIDLPAGWQNHPIFWQRCSALAQKAPMAAPRLLLRAVELLAQIFGYYAGWYLQNRYCLLQTARYTLVVLRGSAYAGTCRYSAGQGSDPDWDLLEVLQVNYYHSSSFINCLVIICDDSNMIHLTSINYALKM